MYIATGSVFSDALSGAPVAGMVKAPLLLTAPTAIPSTVLTELQRLKPTKIVILGGTGSVSAGVAATLSHLAPVTRWWGPDRYSTSAAISAHAFPDASKVSSVYIATGLVYSDALSGAPVAAMEGAPLLLTAPTVIPASVKTELGRLRTTSLRRIVILGGTASVSTQVEVALRGYLP